MSYEHKKYIKKYKRRQLLIKILQILLSIIIIFIWQLLANKKIINTFITSSPKNIVNTLLILYKQNNLFFHIWTTIKETIISFTITTILSIIISLILYNYQLLAKVLEPYLTILNSLPKVSLGPIIIIWLGANNKSIILMAVLISIIVSIQNIYNAFKNTDILKLKLLNTFNSNKLQNILYVVIPENKSVVLNSLKINISMCLIGVISGEFLTSKAGLGYLILYGSQIFNLDLVMSGIFLLLVISFIMYNLVVLIIKK